MRLLIMNHNVFQPIQELFFFKQFISKKFYHIFQEVTRCQLFSKIPCEISNFLTYIVPVMYEWGKVKKGAGNKIANTYNLFLNRGTSILGEVRNV